MSARSSLKIANFCEFWHFWASPCVSLHHAMTENGSDLTTLVNANFQMLKTCRKLMTSNRGNQNE